MLVHKIQQAQVQIQLLPPLSLNKLLNLLPKSLKCQQCMPSWKSCFRIWNKGLAKSQHLINGNSYYFIITDEIQINPCAGSEDVGTTLKQEWGLQEFHGGCTSMLSLGKWVEFGNVARDFFFFLTLFSLLLQTGTHFALLFFAVYESNHDVTED
jgi:hypothetical protein